jgi:hypothetical protein
MEQTGRPDAVHASRSFIAALGGADPPASAAAGGCSWPRQPPRVAWAPHSESCDAPWKSDSEPAPGAARPGSASGAECAAAGRPPSAQSLSQEG